MAALASWLIPPIFALAAALVHFQFHVPTSEIIPRDDDDKKKAKGKPKKPAKQPPKSGKKSGTARELSELEQLRTRWSGTPIADEPDDKDFRRHHESLLRGVVQVAREAGNASDRTAIVRVSPRCHTIRCTVEVCAALPILDAVVTYLPQVESSEGPLWHEIAESTPQGEPPDAEQPSDAPPRACRAWLVGFVSDGVKRSELLVPGVTPARVEKRPVRGEQDEAGEAAVAPVKAPADAK